MSTGGAEQGHLPATPDEFAVDLLPALQEAVKLEHLPTTPDEFAVELLPVLQEAVKLELRRELQQFRGHLRQDVRLELQDLHTQITSRSESVLNSSPSHIRKDGARFAPGTKECTPTGQPIKQRFWLKGHAKSFSARDGMRDLHDSDEEEGDLPKAMRRVTSDASKRISSHFATGSDWSASATPPTARPKSTFDSSDRKAYSTDSALVPQTARSGKTKKLSSVDFLPDDDIAQILSDSEEGGPVPPEQGCLDQLTLPTSLEQRKDGSIMAVLPDAPAGRGRSWWRRRHSSISRSIPTNSYHLRPDFRSTCRNIVRHNGFDGAVATVILLNALMMGWVTDYSARNLNEAPPVVFAVLEAVFAMFFVLELGLRMVAYGVVRFFTMASWKWNILDLFVVCLQVIETLLMITRMGVSEKLSSLSIMRMMRVLRLLRSIRVVRLLRYLRDLRTVMVSVMSALKPLCSTLCLIVLIIFVTAILFTELATVARLDRGAAEADLKGHFDSLSTSMMRLFQAITNGVDWDSMLVPLMEHVSPAMGLVVAVYIVFMNLAILNIVTGVFVDAALTRSRKEKDHFMVNNLREFFTTMDVNGSGTISWDEFKANLDEERLIAFFKDIDLCVSEAKGLFMLLDSDCSGQVDMDEFLSGCLNLRGPARALDMQLLMRELLNQRHDRELTEPDGPSPITHCASVPEESDMVVDSSPTTATTAAVGSPDPTCSKGFEKYRDSLLA